MAGVSTAYYLIHSMDSGSKFEELEFEAARNFARAALQNGVSKIIYLGGLVRGEDLSPHMRSRIAVGKVFQASKVPTFEFRASIIIGSGSLSFEMIRSLVNKLPVMITPRWVHSKAQPIAIEDVIEYLIKAWKCSPEKSGVYEIGGADQVSYKEIMAEYARQKGLKRTILPVPVLTPRLSSLWLRLVTPIYAQIGKKLIESVCHDTVVQDNRAAGIFGLQPLGIKESIRRALVNKDQEVAETRWSDALPPGSDEQKAGLVTYGSRLLDTRSRDVSCDLDRAFQPIQRIGGQTGWYSLTWLWQLRGLIDLVAGGVGMRRGRNHPVKLRTGDTIDFWRVEAFEPNCRLLLAAEMKVPGRAWLQFEVQKLSNGSRIRQTAIFDPLGLAGLAYWYCLYPFHKLIFSGMISGIAYEAEREQTVSL
jgi:uncharacterized protein YbjT (DUF2867 family)